MARSRRTVAAPARSSSSSSSSSRPAPQQQQHAPHPPAPVQSQPPMNMQSQQQPSMLSGIGSTIAQGMAFGTGSAIAHRAVGAASEALFGGSNDKPRDELPREQMVTPQQQWNTATPGPCDQDKQMFFDCLKANKGDQQSCSFLYETLQSCQRNSSEMRF